MFGLCIGTPRRQHGTVFIHDLLHRGSDDIGHVKWNVEAPWLNEKVAVHCDVDACGKRIQQEGTKVAQDGRIICLGLKRGFVVCPTLA